MAFTAPKVIPACIVWLDFWKRHYSGFLLSNSMHQIMPENPTSSFDWNCWRSILSCVLTLWCITWSNHVLCCKTLKSLCNLFWYCKWCDFLKRLNVFKRKWIILKEMECVKFDTRNWRKINFLIHTAAPLSLFSLWNWKFWVKRVQNY